MIGPRLSTSIARAVALAALVACGSASGADPDAAPATVDAGPDDWLDLLGAPLATSAPALPAVTHGLTPTGLWGTLPAPHPTNAWFENLALGQGESPVNVLPYLVKALPDRLSVCLPGRVVGETFVLSTYLDNLSLGARKAGLSRMAVVKMLARHGR